MTGEDKSDKKSRKMTKWFFRPVFGDIIVKMRFISIIRGMDDIMQIIRPIRTIVEIRG